MTVCKAQSVKIVKQYPNGEYLLEINGRQVTTIGADRAREIEKVQVERDGFAKEVDLLKQQVALKDAVIAQMGGQIADLKTVAANNEAQARNLDTLRQQMFTLMTDQRNELKATREMVAAGNQKTWLDRFPVRFGIALLGAGANARTMFSPCQR